MKSNDIEETKTTRVFCMEFWTLITNQDHVSSVLCKYVVEALWLALIEPNHVIS
jgi:hypothetical protein